MFHQEQPWSDPSHAGKETLLRSTCLLGSVLQVTVPWHRLVPRFPKDRIGFEVYSKSVRPLPAQLQSLFGDAVSSSETQPKIHAFLLLAPGATSLQTP